MAGALKVMSTLAVELALKREILPAWASRNRDVQVYWSPTGVLVEKIKAGARGDILIAIDEPINDMVEQGILVRGSVRPLARAAFGIAKLHGRSFPEISSVETFKAALLQAKSIVYSRTGASGIHFLKVIDELGIGDDIRSKALEVPSGFTAEKVVSGDAEIAVQQISELMSIDGVDIVGPFPEPHQKQTDFSSAIFTEAVNHEQAASFIEHLTSQCSMRAYAQCGLSPRTTRIAA